MASKASTKTGNHLMRLDDRIPLLIRQGVQSHHRTLVVMIGRHAREQVPILYSLYTQATSKYRPQPDTNLNSATFLSDRANHVLWCYKSELGFSTHTKKVKRDMLRKQKKNLDDRATLFEQFILSTDIRWCYYKETERVLGQTFGMLVLQDFQALTPNILAQTVETVCGGGIIFILLNSIEHLKQLYVMSMDVHTRYRTPTHDKVVPRFNERFLLSLAKNSRCLVLDDRWRVLSVPTVVENSLTASEDSTKSGKKGRQRLDLLTPQQARLLRLQQNLQREQSPFSPLVRLCITVDQTRCLLQCVKALLHHQHLMTSVSNVSTLSTGVRRRGDVVLVTAARGRGKSAALGLSLAAALQAEQNMVWVTAPCPENVATLMHFVRLGLLAFHLQENVDFALVRSGPQDTDPVVRIDIVRQQSGLRQCVAYMCPRELSHGGDRGAPGLQLCDVLCIDEVAAIPLPWVKRILRIATTTGQDVNSKSATDNLIGGSPLVLMATTAHGYEGTGRSLGVKLMSQLREEFRQQSATESTQTTLSAQDSTLFEVQLQEAIRYGNGDPIEAWLFELLCLNCTAEEGADGKQTLSKAAKKKKHDEEAACEIPSVPPPLPEATPKRVLGFTADECELFYVNRDTLFSYHTFTERFLHRLMDLYVASHYRNSPNDLQLLADAPAHHLFVLLPPARYRFMLRHDGTTLEDHRPNEGQPLPFILCVAQVCLEGGIARHRVQQEWEQSQDRHVTTAGDLVPWTVAQQFNDHLFASLFGARIVRIATHPLYQGGGFGSRALHLLRQYYNGELGALQPVDKVEDPSASVVTDVALPGGARKDLIGQEESLAPRASATLPPLLMSLSQRPAEHLDYIGVCFGMTHQLLKFWKRANFLPVYLSEVQNELTGEYSGIMICQLKQPSVQMAPDWLAAYHHDFCCRMSRLLSSAFHNVDSLFALELVHFKGMFEAGVDLQPRELRAFLSASDRSRLRAYTLSQCEYRHILDLLGRPLARWFVMARYPPKSLKLRRVEQLVLVAIGLQGKSPDQLAAELQTQWNNSPLAVTATEILGNLFSLVKKLCAYFDSVDSAEEK